MKFRLYFWLTIFSLAYFVLVANLYNLQFKDSDFFQIRAEKEEPSRGIIYFTDRRDNKIPAALNKNFSLIYAAPKEIENPQEAAEILAPILGQDKDKLRNIFSKDKKYRPLLRKASAQTVKEIKKLNLEGIYIKSEELRYYPFQNLASQVLGFVGYQEDKELPLGLYGLEKFYEQELKKGNDLFLTIDINLQTQAEKILSELIKKFEAEAGTIIIQEPKSGRILALTNKPDFDPNEYSKAEFKLFINPAVQNFYEPGSVAKVFTLAAGLESKKVGLEDTFFDKGAITLNERTIRNWDNKAYGEIKIEDILKHSINTGAVLLQRKIGPEIFHRYLKRFNLDKKTGVDFPLEQLGNLLNLKNGKDIDFATASFGQGIAVSSLVLLNSFSSLINGGNLTKPHFNSALKPLASDGIISQETSEKLKKILEQAVEEAQVTSISNFRLGGKTGTAQIPDFQKGGYSQEFIHSFIGFGPVSDPQFIALIKLDKPKANFSGQTVVPAFRELAQFIFNYYYISPDKY